jgi:alpha-tubulin suppressor-like RCC1 family protein
MTNVTVVWVIQVSTGSYQTLFVKSDSTLWACGDDGDGELCDGTTSSSYTTTPKLVKTGVISAVASSTNSFYITSIGDLYGCGETYGATPVKVMSNVQSVAAGEDVTLILKKDQTVWACGSNYGSFGNNSTQSSSSPVQVTYGGLQGVKAVAAGQDFSMVLYVDGTVGVSGLNYNGELGNGTNSSDSVFRPVPGISNVTSIAASYQQGFAIKSDGSIWGWGWNYDGILGINSSNSNSLVPVKMVNVTNAASVAAGMSFTLATATNGDMWATGFNLDGQLCDGTTTQELAPIKVKTGIQLISASQGPGNSSFFVKTDGTVWACGSNGDGQLGNGTLSDQPSPVQISF